MVEGSGDSYPINSYAEELDKLDKMDAASAGCKEILNNVETRPDPLLPIGFGSESGLFNGRTNGPANPSWDRWFEGPPDKSGCRCWIL
ncbi:G-protein gamma subunit 2 [Artemisia annua]|uniref:G-protein gamma subunit 2 n=1 Tax=Artemisia annua TaxID=35608 RepID=A0A2U1Q1J7_ARTAN|nr:G-protein gamma subunit 2 [Artemisia annua]